jgi:hypothetical protein
MRQIRISPLTVSLAKQAFQQASVNSALGPTLGDQSTDALTSLRIGYDKPL